MISRRIFQCKIRPQFRAYSSASKQDERPQMHQLEHVLQRVEYCTTVMFRQKMDFTFYRKDVILQDDIFNVKKQGLEALMNHFGLITVTSQMLLPQVMMEGLNIVPLLDDGTVRLRWRVKYLTWLQVLNFRNFDPEYREKSMYWFDGYSVFHVDGNGLVFKLTVQKVMPDDSFLRAPKKLAQKLAGLNGNATANSTRT